MPTIRKSINENGDVCAYHVLVEKGIPGCSLKWRKEWMNMPKKLGLITSSSTETEVVSNNREKFHNCTWFRYFTFAQVKDAKEYFLFHDRKSFIEALKNYHFSIGSVVRMKM